MSAIPADPPHSFAQSDREISYFEQRIFLLSPVGTFWTAVFIFAVLLGAFALCAALDHNPIWLSGTYEIAPNAQVALTLALILTTTLAMQRFARQNERKDFMALAAILRGGQATAFDLNTLTPQSAKLGRATIIGVALGLLAGYVFVFRDNSNVATSATAWWLAAVSTALFVLFARGVELTRGASRFSRETLDRELVIDLLRIDRLSVIGRSAARFSLIWFTITAVVLLLFVDVGVTIFTVAFVLACAAMGAWIFVRTMEHVHRKIRAAKAQELDTVRGEIESLRASAPKDADAAIKLQSLVIYEERIEKVREWPFDQSTLVRVGASALILTLPWFGQAIVAYAVEHLHVAN